MECRLNDFKEKSLKRYNLFFWGGGGGGGLDLALDQNSSTHQLNMNNYEKRDFALFIQCKFYVIN